MHQFVGSSWLTLACIPLLLSTFHSSLHALEPRPVGALQALVDRIGARLGIDAPVTATIVASDALLVSVQRVDGGSTFRMAFDERFLAGLDDHDLEAIVAHELGHVWIFTHHPFLQTERAANKVALRVVSRASLERVYSKVWSHQGTKGDLHRFLGPQ